MPPEKPFRIAFSITSENAPWQDRIGANVLLDGQQKTSIFMHLNYSVEKTIARYRIIKIQSVHCYCTVTILNAVYVETLCSTLKYNSKSALFPNRGKTPISYMPNLLQKLETTNTLVKRYEFRYKPEKTMLATCHRQKHPCLQTFEPVV